MGLNDDFTFRQLNEGRKIRRLPRKELTTEWLTTISLSTRLTREEKNHIEVSRKPQASKGLRTVYSKSTKGVNHKRSRRLRRLTTISLITRLHFVCWRPGSLSGDGSFWEPGREANRNFVDCFMSSPTQGQNCLNMSRLIMCQQFRVVLQLSRILGLQCSHVREL